MAFRTDLGHRHADPRRGRAGDADDRRPRGAACRGHVGDGAPRRCCRRRSRSSAPPTASRRSAPAGFAWSRSRAARARPPPARRRPRAAWSCTRRPTRLAKLRTRRDGALHLRPSARLPDLLGQRRLRAAAQAGVVGLRDVRYGYDGANHLDAPKDESNPYFTFEASKCIVCSRCVRACEEVQGTFALTILGRGFASQGLARRRRLHRAPNASPAAPACRPARPRRSTRRASSSSASRSARSPPPAPIAASAARSRRRSRATTVVRMIPDKHGKANEGHSCVKGRFAYGYATHKDRILKPMIRARIDDPWREVSWDEAIQLRRLRVQAHPGQIRARLDRRHHLLALHQRGSLSSSRSWCAPASATTTSTPAPASATRRPATA